MQSTFVLCLGKPVEMSSVYAQFYGSKAVDGVYLPDQTEAEWSQLAQTGHDVHPWMRIDLLHRHLIMSVRILNRISKFSYHGKQHSKPPY